MNRVTVTIAQRDYTLLTDKEPLFTQQVAQYVDEKLSEVLSGGKLSLVDGSILCALNIADDYLKEQESSENLRRQLKEYLEEATRLKLELSEAKREIFKLQEKK